jgi:hypothetical protein
VPAALRAVPLASGADGAAAVDPDGAALAAVDRPAGAVFDVAARAGAVVPDDRPVVLVRLVVVAFRGRVWFAATVAFGGTRPARAAASGLPGPAAAVVFGLSGPASVFEAGPAAGAAAVRAAAEMKRPFAALRTAGVPEPGVAVVWSPVDRSPAAVRGPAEPFVAFAMT